MIVLDASAVLEFVSRSAIGARLGRLMSDEDLGVHAPHLLGVEVAQALRRQERTGVITSARASQALNALTDLRFERHDHEPLLPRVWELRANLTAYDATYVALAEALEAPLLTLDRRLAAAPGHRARVEVLQPG